MIKEATNLLSSRTPPPNLSDTNKLVRGIIREPADPGKKMMKIGAALIMMPEPATSVAGVPLVILGKALSSNKGTNISGVYEELHRSLSLISSAGSL